MKRSSRAEKAGTHTAKTIIELVNLMYQNNTASNFFTGLIKEFKLDFRFMKVLEELDK